MEERRHRGCSVCRPCPGVWKSPQTDARHCPSSPPVSKGLFNNLKRFDES